MITQIRIDCQCNLPPEKRNLPRGYASYRKTVDTPVIWLYNHKKPKEASVMTFRIRHETKAVLFIALAAMMLFFLFMFLSVISLFLIFVSTVFMAAALVCALLYFIEQAVGTSIIIEDSNITIKRLRKKNIIALSDIIDVRIEPYKRYRHPSRGATYTEFRMRMTIDVENGDEIVLTDKATVVDNAAGFLTGRHKRLPDEDVPLYQAYQVIRSKLY